ncbi:hypothetical protein AYI69_g5493 [Smittium culicis]|uniref:Uncharacterized protein n=1 Tax=Smittium culicis TaxID=133412 RepID=A0A1R1Y643_9FUNG|nr:hypothetical protein AYI69_g5493 [Smittium culicis]
MKMIKLLRLTTISDTSTLTQSRFKTQVSLAMFILLLRITMSLGTATPKARAVAETVAAEAVVPSDILVSQAFWSNYTMFDTYYRLFRAQSMNI